jgi:hypothetical protein
MGWTPFAPLFGSGSDGYLYYKAQSAIITPRKPTKAEMADLSEYLQRSERERMNEICAALGVPASILSHRSNPDENDTRG